MVVHEVQVAVDGDDQDSLFGSPPPPQFEGRAVSPALALPSAASTYKGCSSALATPVSSGVGVQNVGTIALPGSLLDSELPIHPLALSLNHGTVPRPPALPQNQPTIAESKNTLPGPAAPPPVHFLRNQENFLGKAGRVGGITVAMPQSRGSTPSNPILIDDDDDTPMIGRRNGSQSRETSQIPIDPIKLAQPTNEEIVSVLVGQKDIFPVLESILRLIAKGALPKPPPPPTGFERRPLGSPANDWSMGPPAKKRKLNRVPAGATDWDVPFPFADGEGPTAYHQNWERDRGKRLIADLIKLIKVASRKAAAKKYIARQKRELQHTGGGKDADTSPGYYRPETILYGRQGGQLESETSKMGNPLQLGDAVPSSGQPNQTTSDPLLQTAIPPSFSPSQEEIQQSLDQLLSSFMESPVESSELVLPRAATEVAQPPVLSVPPVALFDSWMNILDTYPNDFDGNGARTQVLSSEATSMTTPLSVRSTPGIDDFGLLSIPPDLDAVLNSLMETLPPVPTPSASYGDNLNSQDLFSSSLFDLTSIMSSTSAQDLPTSHSLEFSDFGSEPIPSEPANPLFFMPSVTDSSTFVVPSAGISEDLTRPSSPLPSASSESQAMTPASANWDLSLPDIFSGTSGVAEGQGGLPMGVDLGRSFGEQDLDVDFLSSPVMNKGKEKEVVEPSTTTKPIETNTQFGSAIDALTKARDEHSARINSPASSSTRPSTSATTKSTKRSNETDSDRSTRHRRKEDIIRRAKEQRQEVQEGLDNIKRQLWETTIEQAALVHLAKKLELEGEISSEA